jgi:hypothetical protein
MGRTVTGRKRYRTVEFLARLAVRAAPFALPAGRGSVGNACIHWLARGPQCQIHRDRIVI